MSRGMWNDDDQTKHYVNRIIKICIKKARLKKKNKTKRSKLS